MMSAILKDFRTEQIPFFIEKNLDDFYIKSANHPNFAPHLEKKISWVKSKKADWPDCIFRANFENLNKEAEISKVKSLIKRGKAPNGWTAGPLTKPINLGNTLEKNGFLKVYQQAGMAVELTDLESRKIKETKLNIKIADNTESLKQWSTVVSSVFAIKIDFELLEFLMLENEVKFYVGWYEEKPVTSLMLFLSSGVAGLHAVSTLPEYRNKGLALIISRSALIDALKMGYRLGVLQASNQGERIYRILGFTKYCDIITFELRD
jgi:hypothetical protein